jgi:hypothetical protein
MNVLLLRTTCLTALCLALSACTPEPPPTDEPPKPQATAEATELRDAIQTPIDKAKAVEDTVQEAADKQQAEMDAAAN